MDIYKDKTKAELIEEIERLQQLNSSLKVKNGGELFEKIAENYPNSYVSIIKKDLTIGFTSGQEYKKKGLDPNVFIGLSVEQVFAEHAPIVKKRYLKTFKGEEQTFELFINEQYQLYKTLPLTNESGKIDRIIVVVENITDRKKAEDAILESENRYNSLFNSMSEMFQIIELIYNAKGEPVDYYYREVNPAFEKLVGKTRNQLINKRFKDVFGVVEDYWLQEYDKVINTGTTSTFENYGAELKKYFKTKTWKVSENQVAISFDDITEQRKAEENLKRSNEYLEDAQKNAMIGSWDWNIETNTIYWSNEMFFLMELDPNTVIPTYEIALSKVHPEDKESYEKSLKEAMDSKSIYNIKNRILLKNGKVKYVHSKGKVIVDVMGSPIRMFGTVQDISEQVMSETELKDSEKKFRTLYSNSPFGLLICHILKDKNGDAIDFIHEEGNNAIEENTGLKLEQLIGKKSSELVDSETQATLTQKYNQVVKSGESVSYIQYFDLYKKTLQVNAFALDDTKFIISFIDISARMQAEKTIKESEYQYRQLIENLPQRIFSKDCNHRFLTSNEKFAKDMNLTPEELVGKTDFDLFPSELAEKYQQDDLRIMKTGKTEELDEEYIQQGQKKIVHTVKTSMYDEEGEISGVMGIFWDVTEIKKAEEEINKLTLLLKETGKMAKIGGWEYNVQTGEGAWTEEVARIHELDPNEPTNMDKGLSFYTPESRKKIEKVIKNAIDKNITFDLELEMITEKGNCKWVRTIGKPTRVGEKVIRIHGSFQDITERKQFLKKLQERNEYIESIMENIPIGFALNTINDGDVKYRNKLFEEIYGWPGDILTNTSIFFEKVFPDPEYREKMKTQIISDMQSGDPERMIWKDLKIVTSTGEVRFVNAHSISLINQNLMISTVQDTTKRKFAEEELKKYRENLEEIVKERTKNLEEKNKELEKFNRLFVEREFRIKELREQIKILEKDK